MKRVVMSDLTVDHPGRRGAKLFVPGGWDAYVGEVTLDAKTLQVYTRYLGSRSEAVEVAQRVYESGFLNGLRAAIKRRAQEYAERFGDLVEEADWPGSRRFYRLRGFDPERAQALYVPFDNTGRPGKRFAGDVLLEMAQAAREEKQEAEV